MHLCQSHHLWTEDVNADVSRHDVLRRTMLAYALEENQTEKTGMCTPDSMSLGIVGANLKWTRCVSSSQNRAEKDLMIIAVGPNRP